MDEQGIVSLISGDHEKQIDEEVEDDNDAPQTAKCSFSHSEAMQNMDDFLAYYQYQPEATQKKNHNLSNYVSFLLKNVKKLLNKPLLFTFLQELQ